MKSLLQWTSLAVLLTAFITTGCDNDSSPTNGMDELRSVTYNYAFNEGQLLGDSDTAYRGEHDRNISAEMRIEEQENGMATIIVTLQNTIDGEIYPVHAHDAADPSSTPNGTPYNETPNAGIFAQMLEGNGSTAMVENETELSYDELVDDYEGFFVVHDPTQEISTVDLTTYLILGTFAQNLDTGENSLRTESYDYAFNEGQLLGDDATAYGGDHPRNFSATLMIEERGNGYANVTVSLENTLDGLSYAVHAHDAADPSSTPNGTPYNETPNADIFAQMLEGNGGSVSVTSETDVSFKELVGDYEGFLVVHDPTQEISTVDLTTYLILGSFAETLDAGEPKLAMKTFEYNFNEGQLLDDDGTAYDGDHARNLSAIMTVEELFDGRANITVTLSNTLDGEMYPIHTHDAADPDTTENGTPYNETPNAEILAAMIEGNGGESSVMNETEQTLYRDLINTYEGFLVVHDPTQDISTVDLTTYLILGLTAR